MGDKDTKKKKSRFERLTDWGYKWQMRPFRELGKNVTKGVKEGASDETRGKDEALAVLKLRLAKGEISKEQYEELKKTIEN